MSEAIQRFLTQTGTSDGTVSENIETKQRPSTTMSTMEDLIAKLDVQLKLLNLTQGKTKGILDKGNIEGIERHRDALRSIVKNVESVKVEIEQAKFASGAKPEDVVEWSVVVEEQQATADE